MLDPLSGSAAAGYLFDSGGRGPVDLYEAQTAERLSARSLAHSFADGPRSGVQLGS